MSQSEISKTTAVEVKAQTIDRRRLHNRTLREFTQGRMFTICKHRWFSGCLAGVEGTLNNLPDGEREQGRVFTICNTSLWSVYRAATAKVSKNRRLVVPVVQRIGQGRRFPGKTNPHHRLLATSSSAENEEGKLEDLPEQGRQAESDGYCDPDQYQRHQSGGGGPEDQNQYDKGDGYSERLTV